MSRLLTTERVMRHGAQLVAGLAIGISLAGGIGEAHAEDAASLLANPKRLEEVQRGCKANAPWATEALCREAAQAIRLRFRGQGVPYTPKPVDPFPTHPRMQPPASTTPKPKPEASHVPVHRAPSRIF